MSKCSVKYCRSEEMINYLGSPLCELHWDMLCDNHFSMNTIMEDKNMKHTDEINEIKTTTGSEWL